MPTETKRATKQILRNSQEKGRQSTNKEILLNKLKQNEIRKKKNSFDNVKIMQI